MVPSVLVDIDNFDDVFPIIKNLMGNARFVGIDCETQDDNRHDGLNLFCGYDPVTRKKAPGKKLVFDMRRTVMTGFSIYPEGADTAFYINLNHADVSKRIPWDVAKYILDAKAEGCIFIAHNANYELTSFKSCYNYDLGHIVCTMQMAVTCFGPDEYSQHDFISAGQGGIGTLIPSLMRNAHGFNPDTRELSSDLWEVVGKIISKSSDAAHSYNGFVKSIAYGYGLKNLIYRFFKHKMTTFEEVLGKKAHMGELTGPEVADYGADDAYWAMRLFHRLLDYMAKHAPESIDTFFSQENPIVQVYSHVWQTGMRVDFAAITKRRTEERAIMAGILRKMKVAVKELLPFSDELVPSMNSEKWYVKGGPRLRKAITEWAMSPDSEDDFEQCYQVRGPVSIGWSKELGLPDPQGPNFSHYMPMRVLIYDLCSASVIRNSGKVQSDGSARGKIKDKLGGSNVIDSLNQIAGVEQRMKLYLTPYMLLTDPEEGKLFPVLTSMLATRRMAARDPNPMQLAKRGESTYVRSFFEADYPDHVVYSCDWSSIELVEIGEFSMDTTFLKAYSTTPHQDLHAGSAADILAVDVIGLTEDSFNNLKRFDKVGDYLDHYGQSLANTNRLFTDLKGQPLDIGNAYKYWRTEVGKGANFNYWYSGWLATIGERMGWDNSKTAEATQRYRARFPEAEQWRVNLIEKGSQDGYIILPDGQRRTRFEATEMWMRMFLDKFQVQGRTDELLGRYNALWNFIAAKIQKRAYNQLVNAYIQGTCATIAKRSVINTNKRFKDAGWTDREARFMIPVHDELVYSVHKDLVVEANKIIRGTMLDHPDIFKHCKLDASPAIGLNFEPYKENKSPLGQIELHELPHSLGIGKANGVANDDNIREVVDYLFTKRKMAA